jgi:hypothetical protein
MFAHPLRLIVAAAALLAVGAGDASATVVARPVAATQVREEGGTIAFSVYDATAKTYALYTRARAAEPVRVPVPPSPTPFNADIGTDTRGRPALVYQRCLRIAETRLDTFITQAPVGCELYLYSLALGGGERPIRNANDPDNDDTNPTIWRGRIAWARRYGTDVVVYTKRLTTPRSQPSTRLPGMPSRRCIPDPRRCSTTRDRTVRAMELREDLLALSISYTCRGCGGTSEAQLRLVDVPDRTAESIWRVAVGLAGQTISEPSLSASALAWYFGCGANEPSCRDVVGPHRYDLETQRYTRAAGPFSVGGFADGGSRLYLVRDCLSGAELGMPGFPATDCRIEEVAEPDYTATRPRR